MFLKIVPQPSPFYAPPPTLPPPPPPFKKKVIPPSLEISKKLGSLLPFQRGGGLLYGRFDPILQNVRYIMLSSYPQQAAAGQIFNHFLRKDDPL